MEIITSVKEIKDYTKHLHDKEQKISLIPTMGNLHKGHVSLIDESKKFSSKKIVSIFVNPLQFNDKHDFKTYPVETEKDIKVLKENNIDCLFMPNEEILSDLDYKVTLPRGFVSCLCGGYRPGHFEGVYKIVYKLFNLICPDFVYFGKKDYQQLLLIKFLIKSKKLNLRLVECKTIREANGLAFSSRNGRLTLEQQNVASEIYNKIKEIANNWPSITGDEILKNNSKLMPAISHLDSSIRTEYCEVYQKNLLYNNHGLEAMSNKPTDNKPILFYSGYLSGVRLIDNIELE